jgi:hypothetical protein
MNEMDLLTQFRAEVPIRVSPHAEELFRAGLEDHSAERAMVPARRHRFTLPLAAALAAGLVAAFQLSDPAPVLTVRLLAERAATAALDRPAVPAGQWIYQQTVTYTADAPKGTPARFTEGTWSTADGSLQYLGGAWA